MPEPPEMLNPIVSPRAIIERFEIIREQYRMGLMDPRSFNEVLKIFQFKDASGTLWTPGARTNQWYRRDGSRWVAGNPPEELQMPSLPLELAPETTRPVLPQTAQPAGPHQVMCPTCGATNVGKKFCTHCGTKLSQ